MTNTILILGISIILVSVTFLPLAEGEISWNGFLQKIGLPMEPEVVTRSGQFLVPANELSEDNSIIVTCEPDEVFLTQSVFMNVEPPDFTGITTDPNRDNIDDGNTPFIDNANGWRVLVITSTNVDRLIDISIVCVRPSLLAVIAVGGEWQPTDTTALIIGYSVLNAYWLAPIAIGIGLGIYLTRNRLLKH